MPGQCAQLSGTTPIGALKVPHVGWNSLSLPRADAAVRRAYPHGSQVYFTHSYAAPIIEPRPRRRARRRVCAAVERGNVSGVQFHPEKSGDAGLRILRNWLVHVKARLRCCRSASSRASMSATDGS